MKNRKYFFSILIALCVIILVLAVAIAQKRKQELIVTFFDMGQGDAILISQGDQQMLIDGGRDGKLLLQQLGQTLPFWDRTIETVVMTHPDQDHIGGIVALLQTYAVGAVLETQAKNDSQTFQKVEELIAQKQIKKVEAVRDVSIVFGGGATGRVLYPMHSVNPDAKETNESSVVTKLSFGDNTFLFAGDLPADQERELVVADNDMHAQVLKVGHHGSKYSSSDEFLAAVAPRDAIISVGKNNTYGHPAEETLKRLLAHKTRILRTDQMGTIVYVCQKNKECVLRK